MTYTIIDTDTSSVESVHDTLRSAQDHYHDQSTIREVFDGREIVKSTTFCLHHRIRDDAVGHWVEAL